MSPSHHPGEELLVAHAAGTCGEGVSLLVATHLALCPVCRRNAAAAEAVGGALLHDIAPVKLDRTIAETMARLGEEPALRQGAPPRVRTNSTTPEPLRSWLGGDIDSVRWKRIAPGLSYCPLLKRGAMRTQLARAAPGAGIGRHTHRGEEYTLVLAGSFHDETGRYRRGDVQTATPDLLHRPVTDSGGWCVNLTVVDAPLKFASPAVGLLAKLFGF